jgi:Polyketide cyclase / dehydrase and lipid transport
MIRYQSSIVVDRPHGVVATYVLDPTRHGEWMGDVTSVERLTPGDVGVGSRFRYGIRKGPMAMDLRFRIEGLDPARFVAYQTEPGGPLDWSARLEFEAVDPGRTKVSSSGQIGLHGIRRLMEPLMAGEVRSGEAAELVALKRVLEADAPATADLGAAEGVSP